MHLLRPYPKKTNDLSEKFQQEVGGGGSKAVQNFSENSSVLVGDGSPGEMLKKNPSGDVCTTDRENYIFRCASISRRALRP